MKNEKYRCAFFLFLFCFFFSNAFSVSSRNDGKIVNKGVFQILQGLENNGDIENHNKIECRTHISGSGRIINFYELFDSSQNYPEYTLPAGQDLDSAIQNDMTHAALYELKNQTVPIEKFLESNISSVSFLDGITTSNQVVTNEDGLQRLSSQESSTSAIKHVSENTIPIKCNQNTHIYPAFYSLDGYLDNNRNVPPANVKIKIKKTGPGEAVFHGNNSWFNDTFELGEGKASFLATSKIFGGDVILDPGTELIWHGGEKDEYNTPLIKLNNAKLIFELPTGENSIFSCYAEISGDDSSVVTFTKGTVFIKNDCSDFKGDIQVQSGANFVVKKSDATSSTTYEGKMFGGNLIILDENGNLGGEINIKSNSGLTPLRVNNGTVNLIDDDEQSEPLGTKEIDSLSIAKEAKVVLKQSNANFSNGTTILGELEIAAGDNILFNNLDLNGGVIKLTSNKTKKLRFDGDMLVGSKINMIDNNQCVEFDNSRNNIVFKYGRDLLVSLCVDPQSQDSKSSRIISRNTRNADNSGLVIDVIKFLSPMTDEIFDFQVLELLDENAVYPTIKPSNPCEIIANGDIYVDDLRASQSDMKGFFRVFRQRINGLTLKEYKAFKSAYVPLRNAQISGLMGVNDISNMIMKNVNDEKIYCNISQDDSMYCVGQGQARIEDNTGILMVSTGLFPIFAGYKMNVSFFNAFSDKIVEAEEMPGNGQNVMGGARIAFCNNIYKCNLLLSFSDLNMGIFNEEFHKIKMKSHVTDLGVNFAYNSFLDNWKSIAYSFFFNYESIHSITNKIGELQIENAHSKLLFVSPQIAFNFYRKNNNLSVGASLNKRFGTLKNIVRGAHKTSGHEKTSNLQLFINLKTQVNKDLDVEASLEKQLGNRNGKKISIAMHYKSPQYSKVFQYISSTVQKVKKKIVDFW